VVNQTQGSDYAIWCVAALLYVFDAAKLLSLRELLLVEVGRGQLSAILSSNPFTIAGKVLAFAPVLRPDRGVFVAPWGQEWRDASGLAASVQAVTRLRLSLRVPRVLASVGFLMLFGVGPGLTLLLGPNAAVAYTAALLYPTIVTAIGWLWWRRRRIGLGVARAVTVSVEILACPAFLPNLTRKLTAAVPLQIDGGQILSVTASAEVKEDIFTRLADRAEELIETTSPDSKEGEQLHRYLVTLGRRP
jgi:hypothetical protein